jgi:hypothetical protein
MLEEFYKLGYTNGDENFKPQESSKHSFCKLEKDGKFYFAKYSIDHSVRENSIITDIWWCEIIQKLAKSHGLKIKTPKIIDHSGYWYIAEWIEARPSVTPGDPASKIDQYLEQYAECLVALDKIEISHLDKLPPADKGSTTHAELDRRWQKWTKRPLAEGLITNEQMSQAHHIIQTHQQYVTPHFQHGDFTPWHLLIDGQKNWWLIDGEHASIEKPRYYDLAYMYSRIFTRLHSPKHAAKLLRIFANKAEISQEKLYLTFLPIITSRAVGMYFDALNDIKEDDYMNEAKELLRRSLSCNPDDLFNIN